MHTHRAVPQSINFHYTTVIAKDPECEYVCRSLLYRVVVSVYPHNWGQIAIEYTQEGGSGYMRMRKEYVRFTRERAHRGHCATLKAWFNRCTFLVNSQPTGNRRVEFS